MREIPKQKVNPDSGKDYSESVYASLYNTYASFGQNEQNLIWMRYSGFLVLQGFIVNAIATGTYQAIIFLALALFGIACTTTWHVLNFTGWLNQNVWFSIAAGIKFTKITVPTPTTYWEIERSKKPTGKIYHIAQSVPLALILVYAVIAAIALEELIGTWELATAIALLLVIIPALLIGIIEKMEFDERVRSEDDRPIS
jgi:hypothetical protein